MASLEIHADDDRFGYQADAVSRFDAILHGFGEVGDVGRAGATPIGQRQRVQRGQASGRGRGGFEALVESGVIAMVVVT